MRSGNRGSTNAALRVMQGGRVSSTKEAKGGARNPAAARRGGESAATDAVPDAAADAAKASLDTAPESRPRLPITVPLRTATCPGLKLASPNRIRGTTRGAALSEAARRKRLRDIGLYQTKGTLNDLMLSSVRLEMGVANITITRVAPKKMDDDNYIASCKALRDGIADAFGIADDHPGIQFWYEQVHGRPKEYAVRIEYRLSRSPS